MTARAHTRLLLGCMIFLAAGCAGTTSSQPAGRGTTEPRTRCLVNPTEGDTRPLLFLFCIESP